jgi:retinol dehydrogenase 12
MDGDLTGKVCVVTGANRGIGAATAHGLAAAGARVVIVCRDVMAGRGAVRRINRRALGSAELLVADLASQRSIRDVASEIVNLADHIDVLINNAAVVTHRRTVTADGIELQWAVNHLAPFLLTNLLRDALRPGAGRIITVSSEAHRGTALDFDDLQFAQRYSGFSAYGRTKLANILFTRELARRVDAAVVTANTLHPGVIATKLLGTILRIPKMLQGTLRLPFASPRYGARTSIYLASSDAVTGVTGRYFRNCSVAAPSEAAQDDEAARRLWEVSAEMTQLDGRSGN